MRKKSPGSVCREADSVSFSSFWFLPFILHTVRSMNTKNIILWTLYDFANSVAVIVFFLYFSQWLVIDKGVSDLAYNMLFAVSSIFLVLTAPVFGSIADIKQNQQTYLNRITLLAFVSFICATFVALFFSKQVYLAAIFFLLANYFYQFSFVFYNSLLYYIAPAEKWGRISGIGQAGNWLGQIAGLLIALPFASGTVYLLGESGRAQAFLPAVLVFILLALPMLLFFRLPKEKTISVTINFTKEYKNQWKKFIDLIHAPGMGLFLLAYFFFNDAIVTALNNFPIYLANVFNISDTTKTLLLAGILITSVIGALGCGWFADKVGLKKTLMIVLGIWVIVFPLLAATYNFSIFVLLTVIMGFLFGSIWTVTRAAMTALCPKEKLNFGFSFYTLAERVSTLIGPLTWGVITSLLITLGVVRYRLALISMAVFVAAGIFFLKKVTIPEAKLK